MAKKKIVKLTDEQYFKYIMSLKNGDAVYDADGQSNSPDAFKNKDKNHSEK